MIVKEHQYRYWFSFELISAFNQVHKLKWCYGRQQNLYPKPGKVNFLDVSICISTNKRICIFCRCRCESIPPANPYRGMNLPGLSFFEMTMHVDKWKKFILMMQWWTCMNNDYVDSHTLQQIMQMYLMWVIHELHIYVGKKVSIVINA